MGNLQSRSSAEESKQVRRRIIYLRSVALRAALRRKHCLQEISEAKSVCSIPGHHFGTGSQISFTRLSRISNILA